MACRYTLSDLKKRMYERMCIVEAILSQVDKNKIGESVSNLHKYFYDLIQEDKYKKLLGELHFNTSGIYPYSEQLDEIISRLCVSTIVLSGTGFYIIKQTYLERYFNELDTEKQSLVKEFAVELSKKLKPLEGIE